MMQQRIEYAVQRTRLLQAMHSAPSSRQAIKESEQAAQRLTTQLQQQVAALQSEKMHLVQQLTTIAESNLVMIHRDAFNEALERERSVAAELTTELGLCKHAITASAMEHSSMVAQIKSLREELDRKHVEYEQQLQQQQVAFAKELQLAEEDKHAAMKTLTLELEATRRDHSRTLATMHQLERTIVKLKQENEAHAPTAPLQPSAQAEDHHTNINNGTTTSSSSIRNKLLALKSMTDALMID